MDAREKYRKLYSYFLDVCTDHLNDSLHHKNGVPESGEDMYRELRERLPVIHEKPYENIIREATFLKDSQKGFLLPENDAIDLEKLDLVMYMKIHNLLAKRPGLQKWIRLNRARNEICHLSMNKLCRETDIKPFNRQLKLLKRYFGKIGIDQDTLDSCERRAFSHIQ